jgi:hypothetical protein
VARSTGPKSLRRLHPEELELGAVLRGHIRDGSGRILLRKGQRLTVERMNLLLARRAGIAVYVSDDWHAATPKQQQADNRAVSPQELTEALKRRTRWGRGRMTGRRHERYDLRMRLTLTIQEPSLGGGYRREIVVNTCNVSAGGFAFIAQRFVCPGTVVYACFEALPNRPTIKGVVRNCLLIRGTEHRVGAEFVPFDSDECPPAL